jgi:putative tricarboxylic transport membrane protein
VKRRSKRGGGNATTRRKKVASGSSNQILAYRFSQLAGFDPNYIVFQGGAELNTALLGGSIEIAFSNPSEVVELIHGNRMRGLAVFSADRVDALPEVPTALEEGYDVVEDQFRAIVAPGGLTEAQTSFWKERLTQTWKAEEFQEYLKQNNIEPELIVEQAQVDKYPQALRDRYSEALKGLGLLKSQV